MRAPLGLVGLLCVGLLAVGSTGTLSGWSNAALTNPTASALTGSLAVTHSYNGTSCVGAARTASVACPATLTPQSSPPTSTTDAITNNSNVATTQTVSGASCAPVRMANTNQSGDPMLPRYATTFAPTSGPSAGTGSITFGSGGYAAGITPQTLGGTPGGISLGTTFAYGYGVWFKTTATSGQLFGLGSLPTNSPSTNGPTTFDRALSLTGGKLRFTAAGAAVATSTRAYNNGGWHFAYVSLQSQSLSVLLSVVITTTVTIYVDGTVDGTSTNGGLVGAPLATPTGYWSLGPTFTGSLSDFMVYNSTNSPTSPPAAPYSGATELWPLNDNGITTYSGTLPASISAPCSKVNLSLTFANPTDTSIAGLPLNTFANGTVRSLASPSPGQTQSLTIATSKGTGYTSDIAGLRLYIPLTFGYHAGASPGWTQTLTWSDDPADVFLS